MPITAANPFKGRHEQDTWHWTEEAEQAFDSVMQSGNSDVAELLRAMRAFLKENDMMAYLTMMGRQTAGTPSCAEVERFALSPLRSNCESLSENAARRNFRTRQIPQRDHVEAQQ